MNKKKIVFTTIAAVVAFGISLQGDVSAEPKEAGNIAPAYNGITYFSTGKTPDCVKTAFAPKAAEAGKPFNGITQFDLGMPGSQGNGSCATGSFVQSARQFNGITLF